MFYHILPLGCAGGKVVILLYSLILICHYTHQLHLSTCWHLPADIERLSLNRPFLRWIEKFPCGAAQGRRLSTCQEIPVVSDLFKKMGVSASIDAHSRLLHSLCFSPTYATTWCGANCCQTKVQTKTGKPFSCLY
jgi:hypothetical protein